MVDTQQFDDSSARSQTNSVGLCVSLLGTFTIWLGAHEIVPDAFPRPKALQLFKLVVLQVDHQLHRDQVIDFLWPHLTLRSANSQLYKAIHYVRQALATASPPCPPDTLLELRDEVIRLSAPDGVHTDVGAFEQLARAAAQSGELRCLRQAVTCYKGDLLPADRYEEWTLTSREMLRERFIELLLALGQRCLKAGRLAEAADAFRQALERDKVREPAHRGLMRVYALQGSRARALRQYHRCAEILAHGLGVDPSPETITLHEAVLNNRIQPIQSRPTLPVLGPPVLPPLVGRQAERRTLERMLQQLEQGQGAILTIEGPAGMGKPQPTKCLYRYHVFS